MRDHVTVTNDDKVEESDGNALEGCDNICDNSDNKDLINTIIEMMCTRVQRGNPTSGYSATRGYYWAGPVYNRKRRS